MNKDMKHIDLNVPDGHTQRCVCVGVFFGDSKQNRALFYRKKEFPDLNPSDIEICLFDCFMRKTSDHLFMTAGMAKLAIANNFPIRTLSGQ